MTSSVWDGVCLVCLGIGMLQFAVASQEVVHLAATPHPPFFFVLSLKVGICVCEFSLSRCIRERVMLCAKKARASVGGKALLRDMRSHTQTHAASVWRTCQAAAPAAMYDTIFCYTKHCYTEKHVTISPTNCK